MALRMIEVIVPDVQREALKTELDHTELEEIWEEDLLEDRYRVRMLFPANKVEPVTDRLQKRFANVSGFRMIISPVEATIPRPEAEEEDESDSEADTDDENTSTAQVSREELFAELNDAVRMSPAYYLMLALSGVVAAFGFYRDSLALLIAAMVIAPIIGPNVGLALATTIGDLELLLRAFKTLLLGALSVFGVVAIVGWVIPVNFNQLHHLQVYTSVHFGDLVLGLCAGTAGTLTYTRNFSTSLVGVMVAVALLPPMAASGLLFGSQYYTESAMAMLLALNNVMSISIAGICTFLLQGIRPIDWWAEEGNRTMTVVTIFLWVLLLVLLVAITYFLQVR